METCIVYDTKRENGATKTIVKWMVKALGEIEGVKFDVKRVNECRSFCYDLFIVGSPIYYERPMRSVLEFLSSNKNEFKGKKVAIFIICLAKAMGNIAKGYIKKRYLKPLEVNVSDSLIKDGVFRGWLRKPDYSQREGCIKWIKEVIEEARKVS